MAPPDHPPYPPRLPSSTLLARAALDEQNGVSGALIIVVVIMAIGGVLGVLVCTRRRRLAPNTVLAIGRGTRSSSGGAFPSPLSERQHTRGSRALRAVTGSPSLEFTVLRRNEHHLYAGEGEPLHVRI